MTGRAERDLERAGPRLEALADTTRRTLLRQVAEHGPVTATVLSGELPISRQAIAKQLALLESAGLVSSVRAGRETRFEARPEALRDLAAWLTETGDAWDRRLDRLAARAVERSTDRRESGG